MGSDLWYSVDPIALDEKNIVKEMRGAVLYQEHWWLEMSLDSGMFS